MMVGEIGLPRHEYLYTLDYWEIVAISRGYQHRQSSIWSSARWSTYYLMSAFRGSQYMREAGIYGPKDLLKLPWDSQEEESESPDISDEEIARIRAQIQAENERLQKSREG